MYDRRSGVSLRALEITAVSRIHGTRRIHEVTGGHEEDPFRVQEERRRHHRTPEDTPLRRFGTVRPRVQIPGPRPKLDRGHPNISCHRDGSDPRYCSRIGGGAH